MLYNRQRVHSALDYLSPKRFVEDQARPRTEKPPTALWNAGRAANNFNRDCHPLTCLKRGGPSRSAA
jgi:hypothetical protein